jgi:hypothetical protein
MNARESIKAGYPQADMITRGYLGDLTDEELMARPVEGCNHIAWQLGHLISSERHMVEAVCPGSSPELPEGFAEKHNKETAEINDPSQFLKKEEYLKVYEAQRAATLKALESLSDDDLDKPAPESMQRIAPTVAAIFTMQPVHWMMHAGQWAVLRRKLGRPPLF